MHHYRYRSLTAALAAVTILSGTLPADLGAQADPVRVEPVLSVVLGSPLSGFADRVDAALGVDAGMHIDRAGAPLSLRLGASAMIYGHEGVTTCVSTQLGCRLSVGLTTTNQIWSVEAGPSLRLPLGSAMLRTHLAVGASLMVTNTGLTGDYDLVPLLSKREVADGGFMWGGGVGISIPLRAWPGARPAIELDAAYRQHGVRRYLVEGGVQETPLGVARDIQRSNVSLLNWRVGLSFTPPAKAER